MFIPHSPAALWAGGNWQAGKKFGGLAPFPRVTVPEKRKPWKPNTCLAAVFSPVPKVKIASTVKQGAGALHPAGLKVNSYDFSPQECFYLSHQGITWCRLPSLGPLVGSSSPQALTDLLSSSYDLASSQNCSVEV